MDLERLKPGPELPEDEKDWEGTGQCDGVIFLGEISSTYPMQIQGNSKPSLVKKVHVPSDEKQALRYLKPADKGS